MYAFLSGSPGSSSFVKPIIFNEKITASMLAFLNKEDPFAGCRIIATIGDKRVYQVPLRDDLVVAIKHIRNLNLDEQIRAEIETVIFLYHRKLVPLLAYVFKTGSHFLEYKFMPGGSLKDALQRMAARELTLSWPQRHRILFNVAQALQHLHSVCFDSSIVHRNLSPDSILLDDSYNAKVSKFSLAVIVPYGDTHETTDVVGTAGYIAPEYYQTLRCSHKTDVYSYGVMMLQLVTGLQNPRETHVLRQRLLEWDVLRQQLLKCLESSDGTKEMIDALQGSGYDAELQKAVNIALSCTNGNPCERPTSAQVIQMLLQIRIPTSRPNV